LEGVPQKYRQGLELSGLALRLADDLFTVTKGV
jgi:hypothetical protein